MEQTDGASSLEKVFLQNKRIKIFQLPEFHSSFLNVVSVGLAFFFFISRFSFATNFLQRVAESGRLRPPVACFNLSVDSGQTPIPPLSVGMGFIYGTIIKMSSWAGRRGRWGVANRAFVQLVHGTQRDGKEN